MTATEIATNAAIATKIGTSGEEPPSSEAVEETGIWPDSFTGLP
jgi:hypothetical protein